MNKLVINLPEGTVEYCNSGIVTKLYQLLKAGVNESLSSLMGSIHVDHAYTDYINYIENHNVCKQDGVKKFHIAADSKYILFADPTVESMLLGAGVGDGIGITEVAAALVTRLNKVFKGNTTLEHFDEFGKFSSITTFPNYGSYYSPVGDFEGCTNLKSIDLSNVTRIYTSCFSGCTNLQSLGNFHPVWLECERGYGGSFRNCSSLTSVDLSNCIILGENTFDGCTSLSNIGSLSNVDIICDKAFLNCSNLNIDLRLPALGNGVALLYDGYLSDGRTLGTGAFKNSGIISVSDLGNCNKFADGYAGQNTGCFAGCTNLTFVNLPQDFYYIGAMSFIDCPALSAINGIDHVTTMKDYAFAWCPGFINSVLYCRDLITTGLSVFKVSSIKLLYLPSLNTTNNAGYYTNYHYNDGPFVEITVKLLYFKDVSTFHIDFPKSNIEALVINNTTVPSINPQSDDFSNTNWNGQPERIFEGATIGAIYVPDSAVQSYQNHSIWGTKTIKPISELNKVATKALWDLLTDTQKNTTLIEEYM